MRHPDKTEAQEWVKAETARLRAMSYQDLLALLDDPSTTACRAEQGAS
jgi:hypothetical protein